MSTLTDCQAELAIYKAAAQSIVTGAQSYQISGRMLTRANLAEIHKHIEMLEARIDRLARQEAGGATNQCVPVFINNR